MLEPGGGGDLSAAFVNAILLALWAVLPVLVIGYARAFLLARRHRPEFMLQKSERTEGSKSSCSAFTGDDLPPQKPAAFSTEVLDA